MDMPSRMEIRRWLIELKREDILLLLEQIEADHGKENCQDVKDFLNYEKTSGKANSPAEADLVAHKMRETVDQIESLKKLHRKTA